MKGSLKSECLRMLGHENKYDIDNCHYLLPNNKLRFSDGLRARDENGFVKAKLLLFLDESVSKYKGKVQQSKNERGE